MISIKINKYIFTALAVGLFTFPGFLIAGDPQTSNLYAINPKIKFVNISGSNLVISDNGLADVTVKQWGNYVVSSGGSLTTGNLAVDSGGGMMTLTVCARNSEQTPCALSDDDFVGTLILLVPARNITNGTEQHLILDLETGYFGDDKSNDKGNYAVAGPILNTLQILSDQIYPNSNVKDTSSYYSTIPGKNTLEDPNKMSCSPMIKDDGDMYPLTNYCGDLGEAVNDTSTMSKDQYSTVPQAFFDKIRLSVLPAYSQDSAQQGYLIVEFFPKKETNMYDEYDFSGDIKSSDGVMNSQFSFDNAENTVTLTIGQVKDNLNNTQSPRDDD